MISGNAEEEALLQTLYELIKSWESEIVEFKEQRGNLDEDRLGRYFSAISNEANLKNQQYGWLILGVKEKTREIVGTNYKMGSSLQKLKHTISLNTTDGITFIDIFEVFPYVNGEKKRVLMFQIPAAVTAMPTGWKNRCYGRNGDSLEPLTQDEIDRIRIQVRKDWSKQIVPGATMKHLDDSAIELARKNYKEKMQRKHISEDVDEMSDKDFLTKLKLVVDGKVTNAAMLLLGKEEYDYLFDAVPEVSWRLYNSVGDTKDYELKLPTPFSVLNLDKSIL
ncbi:MAG: putative DNA binding domain-containing protein [Clostridiales bacterium]|nr:putative DNA binding domain-containing protein [Clostridiales bacterium]